MLEHSTVKNVDCDITGNTVKTMENSSFLISEPVEEEIVFMGVEEQPVGKNLVFDCSDTEMEKKESSEDEVLEMDEDDDRPLASAHLTEYRNTVNFMRRSKSENSTKLPADCYSLMSLNGPSSGYFWFGFLVFVFQMVFIALIVLSVILPRYSMTIADDNPADGVLGDLIPTEADPLVRTTQIMSMVAMLVFPDSSMLDLVIAIDTFPVPHLATRRDKIGCMIFSCFLRFVQGFSALIVAFILVISSGNVIDIILNFTALNFISALDNVAFEFACSGKYGPKLQAEVNRIEELVLPVCMYRKNKYERYLKIVTPLWLLVFGMLIGVIWMQEHPTRLETTILRVEILEDGLGEYSGCYRNDVDIDSYKRDYYYSHETDSTFGFCIEDKKWYLYKGNRTDPCNAPDKDIIVHSDKTETFDISTSFLADWFTKLETPADLYFVEDTERIEGMCGHSLGDGICDEIFNNLFQRYDDGDCCAATCTVEDCHYQSLVNPFGSSEVDGHGYSNCRDPKMESLTIQLNEFSSSRDPQFLSMSEENRTYVERKWPHFWEEEPSDTYLTVNCDGQVVLGVLINDSLQGKTETIKVNDGAECRITIYANHQWDYDIPFWYVDYTLYKGDKIEAKNNPIEILRGNSYYDDTITFELIPMCYLKKLEKYLSMSQLYTDNGPSLKALRWLMDEVSKDAMCEAKGFNSIYPLAVLNFAAPTPDGPWISKDEFWCEWEPIRCLAMSKNSMGFTFELNLSDFESPLSGTISSEIGCLWGLTQYNAAGNRLTGTIPSEIGMLKNLKYLKLANNQLEGSIPVEIASIRSLESMNLFQNSFTGTIPTEIGLLTNLKKLDLDRNSLKGSIPSEIGLLTSLTSIHIDFNHLTGSIPSEIGLLTNLSYLDIDENALTGSIPSEMESMPSLERVAIDGNLLNGTIPYVLKTKIVEECIPCDGNEFEVIRDQGTDEICADGLEKFFEGNYRLSIETCDRIRHKCFVCASGDKMKDGSLSVLDEESLP